MRKITPSSTSLGLSLHACHCNQRLVIFIYWILSSSDYIVSSFFSLIFMFYLLFVYATKNSSMVFWEATSFFFIVVTCTYAHLTESHYISWPLIIEFLCPIVMNTAVSVNKEGICYVVMDAKELFT
jgi:hypothetical protein